jgi:hypothetical protein
LGASGLFNGLPAFGRGLASSQFNEQYARDIAKHADCTDLEVATTSNASTASKMLVAENERLTKQLARTQMYESHLMRLRAIQTGAPPPKEEAKGGRIEGRREADGRGNGGKGVGGKGGVMGSDKGLKRMTSR